jgi:hypothetical protein
VKDTREAEYLKIKKAVEKHCDELRATTNKSADSATYKFVWTTEIAEMIFATCSRLFFASSKFETSRYWVEVTNIFPSDFDVTEDVIRKKYVQVQKKKTSTERDAIIGLPAGSPA